ncbi:MAG: hypothetical protein LBM70_10235 [Victivallales bacterium]|jgi:hypothetical protein|nr:hypothetical protein [Victivallales bacterium]
MRSFANILISLAIFLPFALNADQLDDMFAKLDRLERVFWQPMRTDSDEYRAKSDLLFEVIVMGRSIQSIASNAGSKLPNLTVAMNQIKNVFDYINSPNLRGYRCRFKYTSMREYAPQFRQDLSVQERKERPKPTLDNVSVDDYQNWLLEIADDNSKKVSAPKGANEKVAESLRDHVTTFFTSIATIRVTLVKYRQEKKIRFP